jgi:uncharacterized protein (DUF58 family)
LASYFLNNDLSLGMIVNDGHDSVLPLDRGARQIDRALEALAVTHADTSTPLAEMLTLHETKLMRNSAVIIITPSWEVTWGLGLRQLERRGVHASVIALDGASFGGSHTQDEVREFLVGIGVSSLPIHQGTPLISALEASSES